MAIAASDDLPELMARLSAWRVLIEEERLLEAPDSVHTTYQQASAILSGLKSGDIDPWLGRSIHSIIRKSTRFIVYLDDDLEVQWWWLVRPKGEVIGKVQARVTQLIHESAFLLADSPPRPWRDSTAQPSGKFTREAEDIRAAIGEAMAVALNQGTQQDCDRMLMEAARFIQAAKDQHCRPHFLVRFINIVAALTVLSVGWRWLITLPELQALAFVQPWLEAGTCGAFGALLSSMLRTKDLGLEPAAGKCGLRLDALARAVIGLGAGILTHLAFDSGLIAKDALRSDTVQDAVLLFLCIAAGASERILPSLVERAETLATGSDHAEAPNEGKQAESAASQSGAPRAVG